MYLHKLWVATTLQIREQSEQDIAGTTVFIKFNEKRLQTAKK